MNPQDHEIFLKAIHDKMKVRLQFTRVNGTSATRLCAPLDFGPVRREQGHPERYQFWDLDARPQHWLSLPAERITRIEATDEPFTPGSIITWDVKEAPWSIPRDWGRFS